MGTDAERVDTLLQRTLLQKAGGGARDLEAQRSAWAFAVAPLCSPCSSLCGANITRARSYHGGSSRRIDDQT